MSFYKIWWNDERFELILTSDATLGQNKWIFQLIACQFFPQIENIRDYGPTGKNFIETACFTWLLCVQSKILLFVNLVVVWRLLIFVDEIICWFNQDSLADRAARGEMFDECLVSGINYCINLWSDAIMSWFHQIVIFYTKLNLYDQVQ